MSEEIRIVTVGDRRHLVLTGHVGILHAEELLATARAIETEGCDVVVSGEALEHLDTAALQILLALRTALVSRGRTLLVQGLPESVRHYLRLSDLERHLPAADVAA